MTTAIAIRAAFAAFIILALVWLALHVWEDMEP